MSKITLLIGDCLDHLQIFIEDESIHSIVTDPPYGLSFMGKDWDKALPPTEVWAECLRVLKPGGYIIAMSSSRTYHRLAVQLEDLGFITHPMIGWIYGSGFPKATDLSKQFDNGVEREVVGKRTDRASSPTHNIKGNAYNQERKNDLDLSNITAPSTDLAKKWVGWKYGLQSLKPALEPIYVGQKPHLKPMVRNVEKYGVGAMNIDACRVSGKLGGDPNRFTKAYSMGDGHEGYKRKAHDNYESPIVRNEGRHPANLLHDGSESVEKEFLEQGGIRKSGARADTIKKESGVTYQTGGISACQSSEGSASRFFNSLPIQQEDMVPFLYQAKASKRERNEGLESFEKKKNDFQRESSGLASTVINGVRQKGNCGQPNQNHHPTVKPIALMEWLVKLVTPIGGTCLDPFMGSGTTGIACKKNGFNFIGIEKEKEYYEIALARIKSKKNK